MFYFEVPGDNKLVDLVKQVKKGEMDIYLGLFLFSYQSISLSFHFFSRIMNGKKSRNSRGKTRAMETHLYTMDFFFLSQEFSYEHSERFLTIFFYPISISIIVNAKESRNSIGKTRAMETHLYTMQFLFSCTRTFL